MIAGAGLTTCYQQIKTKTPHLVGVTGIFLILGYALMTVKPKYEAYYQERAKKISTKIEDAVQLKAQWKYFILPHSLVILPSVDRILTHYVSGDVTKANVTTLLEGKVNEIIFFFA